MADQTQGCNILEVGDLFIFDNQTFAVYEFLGVNQQNGEILGLDVTSGVVVVFFPDQIDFLNPLTASLHTG